ncbi:MAG TPA: hypothetical protein VN193_14070 [Candidatus Angelobacter sp.]|jgi:hypothetical protein|nr:hypothetical protein [Candidatus Angelobacter sp.]
MNRRLLGSAIFASVVALGVAVGLDPVAAPTVGSSPAAQGVTLTSSTVELVASKTTPTPTATPSHTATPGATPSSTPCNAGGGNGNGNGRCATPNPSPSPSATSCPGSCKPLLSDSKPGAILRASRMKPGDVARGTVVLTANGNVYVSLFESNLTHSGPAGSGNLAHRLALVITDQTMNLQLYSGVLDAVPASISVCGSGPPPHPGCQRWANNESHTFLFVVTFPNAGNNSDNAYQQTGASADFVWGATR